MNKKLFIFIISLILMVNGAGLIWQWKIHQRPVDQGLQPKLGLDQTQQANNQDQIAEEVQSTVETSDWQSKNHDEIFAALKDLFQGNISYDKKKGNVVFFEREYDLLDNPAISLTLSSDQYKNGGQYSVEYEGLQSTNYLDKEVKTLTSLHEGTQIVQLFGPLGYEKVKVTYRSIGGKMFGVYDLYLNRQVHGRDII